MVGIKGTVVVTGELVVVTVDVVVVDGTVVDVDDVVVVTFGTGLGKGIDVSVLTGNVELVEVVEGTTVVVVVLVVVVG